MRLFAIPTNRPIKKALDSLLREVAFLKESCSEKIYVCIVDNSSPKVSKDNQIYIDDMVIEGIELFHFDIKKQSKVIGQIERMTQIEDLDTLLLPDNMNYGKITNMIYLIASMLDCEYVHRRDSDCVILNLTCDDFPVKEEYSFLGKEIRGVCNKNGLSEDVLICGSDYYGEWNLDLKRIYYSSPNLVKRLIELNDIQKQDLQIYLDTKYDIKNCKKTDKPILYSPIELCNEKNKFLYPECGNVGIKTLFRYIPCFIGQNGIGYDYNTINVARVLGIPIIYHPNKIYHVHDSGRKIKKNMTLYWKGMMKQYDLSMLFTRFCNIFAKECNLEYSGAEYLSRHGDEEILELYLKAHGSIPMEKRKERIDRLLEVLYETNLPEYNDICDELCRINVIEEIDQDYHQSFKLMKEWKKIIDVCKSFDKVQCIEQILKY